MPQRKAIRAFLLGSSAGLLLVAGCATPPPCIPCGSVPGLSGPTDQCTAVQMATPPAVPSLPPAPPAKPADPKEAPAKPPAAAEASALQRVSFDDPPPKLPAGARKPFELPPGFPGADTPIARLWNLPRTATAAEREQGLKAYPELPPLPPTSPPAAGAPATLADLQALAEQCSPLLRRAQADAEAAYGVVIQAGLHPNPTVGYEGDQVQPGNKPSNNAGQQGMYFNQAIKFPGKLSLAQAVAGFDYLNALVAVRKAKVDLNAQVRGNYYSMLVARKAIESNRALAALADEVYRLQLRQLAGGEAAGYEPLQVYAQAALARGALAQAEAAGRAAWRQLAAALGQPDLPEAPLAGRADAAPPAIDYDWLRNQALARHTDLRAARNSLDQAEVNLRLQRRLPYPDLQTNTIVQHDNSTGNKQFSVQVGVALPVFDRNQGGIRQAEKQIARAAEHIRATRNEVLAKLAEAIGRYEAARALAENYRSRAAPSLAQAYLGMIRRYQVEPDKVGFNEVVVAQQTLAQALQGYLQALDAQWKAVVDVANAAQLDDWCDAAPPGAAAPAP